MQYYWNESCKTENSVLGPRGTHILLDADGNDISNNVVWCDTELGIVEHQCRDALDRILLDETKTKVLTTRKTYPAPLTLTHKESLNA